MSAHFTVVGDSIAHEARSFNPARNGKGALAVWGLVLVGLLLGAATVAAVTATAWLQGAVGG